MSEYGITSVCYNQNDKNKGIKKVKYAFILQYSVVDLGEKTKEQVVSDIEKKLNTYYTCIDNKKGALVEVVEEANCKYIRTVGNTKKEDNLSELPVYQD